MVSIKWYWNVESHLVSKPIWESTPTTPTPPHPTPTSSPPHLYPHPTHHWPPWIKQTRQMHCLVLSTHLQPSWVSCSSVLHPSGKLPSHKMYCKGKVISLVQHNLHWLHLIQTDQSKWPPDTTREVKHMLNDRQLKNPKFEASNYGNTARFDGLTIHLSRIFSCFFKFVYCQLSLQVSIWTLSIFNPVFRLFVCFVFVALGKESKFMPRPSTSTWCSCSHIPVTGLSKIKFKMPVEVFQVDSPQEQFVSKNVTHVPLQRLLI